MDLDIQDGRNISEEKFEGLFKALGDGCPGYNKMLVNELVHAFYELESEFHRYIESSSLKTKDPTIIKRQREVMVAIVRTHFDKTGCVPSKDVLIRDFEPS